MRHGTTVQHAPYHPVRRVRRVQSDRIRSRAARLRTLTRRRQRALLATAAAGVVALVPTPAQAALQRVERAQAVAVQWWHAAPAQCPQVATRRAETNTLQASYWQSYLPPVSNWVGLADSFSCTIYLRRSWLAERQPWRMYCMVYLHEWGHLLGRQHPAEGAVLRNRYDRIMVPGTGLLPRACRG